MGFSYHPEKHTIVQTLKDFIENELRRLLEQNPLRTNFQERYEEIVVEYNREKDRVTVEETFDCLVKLVQQLHKESKRAVGESLDEESLAVFDILTKSELNAADRKRIKQVSVNLLTELKAQILSVNQWRDKEATRDAVRVSIRDFLWSDNTGLPMNCYQDAEVDSCAQNVFQHVYRTYPQVPAPNYASA